MRHRTWRWINAVLVLLAGMLVLLSRGKASADDVWGANYFPNVTLTTHEGKQVKFYDDLLKGKIVAINLVYTHCVDVCPLETARLAQVQKMLGDRVGKDIFFYSISIDPDRDTPARLKEYVEKYKAGKGWYFLTGKKADIELISKKLALFSEPDLKTRDGHAAYIMLGNEATGQWIRNAALDNPRFLAVMIGDWLDSWKNNNGPVKSYSEAPPLAADLKSQGRYLFATHCAACHSVGHGDKIGPDLLGVTNIRERSWLRHFIQAPEVAIRGNDPIATQLFEKYRRVQMPNLQLDDDLANSLIDYLASEAAAHPQGGQ